MFLNKVLITGSSSGLGRHLALYFAQKGHDIVLHGRNIQKLQELQKEISKLGVEVEYYSCNLNEQPQILSLSQFCIDKEVKILINNAGLNCPTKKLEDLSLEDINEMIDINLKAPIILIKYLSKQLKNIININSMVTLEVKKLRTLYSASKSGLRGFSNSLKLELKNINILDIYPTNIQTNSKRKNAMDIDFVLNSIYSAYLSNKSELILDGRKNNDLSIG